MKEPSGGNNWAPLQAGASLKEALLRNLRELDSLSIKQLREKRYAKFREIGKFLEPSALDEEFIT